MNLKKIVQRAVAVTAAVLVLGIIASLPFYFHDMSQMNKNLKAASKTISSPYGTIEYIDVGEGTPVLISHGTMGGYDFGLLQAQGYLNGKYRLIVPSRFGYLQSSLPDDSTFEAQADCYAYLLNALGIERAVVEGMSAGGIPAIQFAIRHPDKCSGLILLSTVAYAPPSEYIPQNLPVPGFVYDALLNSDYLFWDILKLSPSTVLGIVGAFDDLKKKCSREELQILDRMAWSFMPVSRRYDGWKQDAENINRLKEMPLGKIDAPVIIINAEDDTIAPQAWSSHTAENIPESRLITFKTGGHMLLGHMAEIKKLSDDFIMTLTEKNRI